MFRVDALGLYTKLRPGVRDFLANAATRFELHVSTMGSQSYALAMAKILDPKGTLFGGRVVGRQYEEMDGPSPAFLQGKGKELDELKGLQAAVLILDDTRGVWPKNQANLVVVER